MEEPQKTVVLGSILVVVLLAVKQHLGTIPEHSQFVSICEEFVLGSEY